jgi:hypothetical protein
MSIRLRALFRGFFPFVRRQEEYFARRGFAQDQLLRLIGLTFKNMYIGDDDLGPVFKHGPERFGCIPGFRYDFNIRFVFEQTPQSLAQQNMIVHQNAPNFSAFTDLCVRTHKCSFLIARGNCDVARIRSEPTKKTKSLIHCTLHRPSRSLKSI